MTIYRQGNGSTKTFKALGPTERANGEPLAISEIANYIRFVEWTDVNGTVQPVEQMDVLLIEDVNTPEYDGEFNEIVDIDALALGNYNYWYRTVDTGGRESVDSVITSFEVRPPFAAPNPPTSISIS